MTQENKIRFYREQREWSAAELAEKTGTTEQQICRLETGKRKLTVEWLRKISVALGIGSDELVDLPMTGINKADADPVLIDTVVDFLTEACDKAKVKASKRQRGEWATFIVTTTLELGLNFRQTRGLANLLVKSSKHSKN